jgi:exodeoxyribonuclease VII small subunit
MTRLTMANAKPPVEIKDMSFERALRELESIVERLEKGSVELEESIAIYERGEALREHCDRLLKQAEARVEKLTLGPNGTPTGTEPYRPQE